MEKEPRFFRVETDGPVVIWKFDHPPKNLWDAATGSEFDDLVERFEGSPDLRAGIITSALPDVFIPQLEQRGVEVDW